MCRKSYIVVSLQINHGMCCAASLCIMGAVTSQLGKVWNNNQGEITQCHETSAANINGNILTSLLSRGVSSNDLERFRLSFHPSVRLVNNRQSLSVLAAVICWSKGSGGLIIFIQRKWPFFPLLRQTFQNDLLCWVIQPISGWQRSCCISAFEISPLLKNRKRKQ